MRTGRCRDQSRPVSTYESRRREGEQGVQHAYTSTARYQVHTTTLHEVLVVKSLFTASTSMNGTTAAVVVMLSLLVGQ